MRRPTHPSTRPALWIAFAGLTALGCGGEPGRTSADVTAKKPSANFARDLLETDLTIDVAKHRGTAVLRVAASTRRGASFEVGGLDVKTVSDDAGPVAFEVREGRLDVDIPAKKPARLTVTYGFKERSKLEGALESGSTFLWPYFCGNLFPCKSAPADGLRFGLKLEGVPQGATAIHPDAIGADAPSYMIAWAIGDYTKKSLGTTAAGTHVSVWYLPGEAAKATKGTAHLVDAFEWLEQTYGPYTFGSDVGSVSAAWGPGAFGGMEHHPYWHVAQDSLDDEETHVHEAAHGWFGDGVRLRCWEDLTLSEGTVTYLAARALEAVAGKKAGDATWAGYREELDTVVASEDRKAWPSTCNEIDVLHDLWNQVPYMKGAFFYRAVEDAVGREALDRAIARLYQERKNTAAGVQDMLDTIEAETGFDPTPLAHAWLQSLGTPE